MNLEHPLKVHEQLESTLRATEITLSKEALKKIDEIFPGPGGEAPKAYAW
jgi:hypothetical protein